MRMWYTDAYLYGIYYHTFCSSLYENASFFSWGQFLYWYYWKFVIIQRIITSCQLYVSWFSCHLDMICVPPPLTLEACVSMTISQKKKMLQNILIWYFLLFLWCKNLPQKKTFIAMMHSSWWINYITSSKLL